MKKCNSCNKSVEDDAKFCPACGKNEFISEEKTNEGIQQNICPNCNTAISEEDTYFCPNCGNKLQDRTDAKMTVQTVVSNTAESVKNSAFVQSVKSDLSNSKTVDMIKSSAQNTVKKVKTADNSKKKKGKIVAIISAVVLVLILVVSNIHVCEECDEVYFGKKHTISFWDETEDVCKDCYRDFHSFF